AVSPDGALVAANTGIGLKRKGEAETAGTTLWNTTDGSLATRFDKVLAGAITWLPDGSLLALGGPEHIEITTVEGEVLWTLTGHTPPREGARGRGVQELAFSADGSTLISLGADGTVRLWTGLGAASSPGEILHVRALRPLALRVQPDGARTAVTAPPRGGVRTGPQPGDRHGHRPGAHGLRPRARPAVRVRPGRRSPGGSGPAGDRCRPRRRRPGRRARRRDLLDGLPGAALGPGTG